METVYIETTIVSYLVARPSRDLIVAAHQQLIREWWDTRRAAFACCVSQVVMDEAQAGDPEQAALRIKALQGFARQPVSGGAEQVAAEFLRATLPATAARDALHLAIAAVAKIDYLLTWNYAHLANAQILTRLEPIC